MVNHRAYEFRIYPNRIQRQLIAKTFGCTRLVYNHFLSEKTQRYGESKTTMSYTDCAKDLTRLKKEKTFLKSANKKSSTF
jgi:putative transposase